VIPDRWSARGEAEVQGDGRVMLVWQGIPGEKTVARIEHDGQNQVLSRWLRSPEPDPHRVEPACAKYAACGGCPLMHLDVAGQDDARRSLVRRSLDEAGLGDVQIGDFHRSPAGQAGFRHVVKLGFGVSDMGHLRVGAWGRNDRRVVPIPDCVVAAPVLARTMSSLAHLVIDMDLRPYDARTGAGLLRSAVLRASHTTGEVLVTLVAGRPDRALGELAERLCQMETSIVGVWLHLNDTEGNAIFERDERLAIALQIEPSTCEIAFRRNVLLAKRLDPGFDLIHLGIGIHEDVPVFVSPNAGQ
jgi:23S rRNA (uracil1939-C5)-methyltransferase